MCHFWITGLGYDYQTKFYKHFKNKKIKISDSDTRMFALSEYVCVISSYNRMIELFRLKFKKNVLTVKKKSISKFHRKLYYTLVRTMKAK